MLLLLLHLLLVLLVLLVLRLVRTGSTFTASRSANGTAWTTIGTQSITMGSTVYIGLPVTSRVDGTRAAAGFDNVTATP